MADVKDHRRRAIAGLIRGNSLSSQEELAERLAGLGFAATQATISRDLEQIGAVKIRRAGRLAYALPDEGAAASAEPHLAAVLRDWVRSIRVAGNLVVIKSPPGSAHLIGVALDQSDLAEIVGTVCGDDTIFVAVNTPREARLLAKGLQSLRAGGTA